MIIEHLKGPMVWNAECNCFTEHKPNATVFKSVEDLPDNIEDNDGSMLVFDGNGWYFLEDDQKQDDEIAIVTGINQ